VDAVAELVEEGDDFVVLEQARLFRRRLGEIADKGCCRVSTLALFGDEALIYH